METLYFSELDGLIHTDQSILTTINNITTNITWRRVDVRSININIEIEGRLAQIRPLFLAPWKPTLFFIKRKEL